MSLEIGIVGLPNVGKSTLFNALTKSKIACSNYPFCTVEPNTGVVYIPDKRLKNIQQIAGSREAVPASIKFIDIAGLVKNAHKGEGLGNQFLSHIREVDAIALVIRLFPDEKITHISGKIEPIADTETIITELILSDIQLVEKLVETARSSAKSGNKENKAKFELLQKLQKTLNENKMISMIDWNKESFDFASAYAKASADRQDKNKFLDEYNFLTTKPMLFIANLSEKQIPRHQDLNKYKEIEKLAQKYKAEVVPISAKIEMELSEIPIDEQEEYLESLNLEESGLIRLINASKKLLDLITFFTAEANQCQAWNIEAGATAFYAAGKIHTDFAKKFIKAGVISYNELLGIGSWKNAKDEGKIRLEGKDYKVANSDVIHFQHG
ncbi:MAG: redox-regulated ATPase YchF [bacterium]